MCGGFLLGTPPQLNVTQGDIRAAGEQFYIPFTVENTGDGTTQTVRLIAELTVGGEMVEAGEQQIEFLSGGETAQGEFIFNEDPASGARTLRSPATLHHRTISAYRERAAPGTVWVWHSVRYLALPSNLDRN